MSAFALICGRLHGEPVTRPTKTGGQVTFFKLRVATNSATQFWDVTTFSDAVRDELHGLVEGSAVSAVGEFHVEPYEWNGKTRLSFRLTTDRVLTLKAAKRTLAVKSSSRGRGARDAMVALAPK